MSGTLTAGALSVAGISSSGALIGPYVTATSTTATSTFAGVLAVGSNALNVLSNGKVGIGTASPGFTLDVQTTALQGLSLMGFSTSASTYGLMRIGRSNSDTKGTLTTTVDAQVLGELQFAGVNTGPFADDGASIQAVQNGTANGSRMPADLLFLTGNTTVNPTERMRITKDGNVGIGTTTPGSLLSLGTTNGINFSTATSSFNSTGGINLAAGCFAIGGNCLSLSTLGGTLGLSSGGTATTTFYNGGVLFSDGTKLTQSAAAANLFWDETNKRLGVGTASPGNRFEVRSTTGAPATSGTTQTAGLRISADQFNTLDFGTNSNSDYAWIQSTRAGNLATNDKLALNPNGGFVGIGAVNPARRLQVVGANGANDAVTISNGYFEVDGLNTQHARGWRSG